jgi:hypothetical protein
MSLPPYIICCASGECCQDGSPEQREALASIIAQELTRGHDTKTLAQVAAIAVLRHFKLQDRKGRKTLEDFQVDA